MSTPEPRTVHHCSLRCWTCGESVFIKTDGPPQSSLDLLSWAKEVGWIGAVDHDHSRALVFCSDGCVQAAKKKNGTFRMSPPPRLRG